MLDLAAKYEEQLQKIFADITFDDKYKYLYSSSYREKYKASESTWNIHEFVSIHNGEIIGFLRYSIDRDASVAYGVQIANFKKPNIIFAKDLTQFIKDVFEKFRFRKLKYCCYVGNPIESQYDKLTEKYGGRIVGIQKQEDKLIDGKFYDVKLYEILREDYLKAIKV